VARVSGIALWVGVVSLNGAGALARFLIDATVSRRLGGRLPMGTAVVNLSGALALGVLTGLATTHGLSLLLGTALVGSYTTFSTWLFETLMLTEDGRTAAAIANVVGQSILGLVLAAAGWALGAAL
jgi:CrcB protein